MKERQNTKINPETEDVEGHGMSYRGALPQEQSEEMNSSTMNSAVPRAVRRFGQIGAAVLFLLTTLGLSTPAEAVDLLGSSGAHGHVYGFGATVCTPFLSSGFSRNYIEIGSPLVTDTTQVSTPGVIIIGGSQTVRWQPWLEKYVNGRWVLVWTGNWRGRLGYQSVYTFDDVFIDIRNLARYPGRGYFRTGGTVEWVADSSHYGGWVQYRHSAGNYFKDGYAHWGGAGATPLSTPYCYAG